LFGADEQIAKSPKAVHRALPGGEGVVLNVENGLYHGLNETGAAVWELIDGERTFSQIVAELRVRVEDAPAELEDETGRFLLALRDRGLIAS
jgi:hypothetical protein